MDEVVKKTTWKDLIARLKQPEELERACEILADSGMFTVLAEHLGCHVWQLRKLHDKEPELKEILNRAKDVYCERIEYEEKKIYDGTENKTYSPDQARTMHNILMHRLERIRPKTQRIELSGSIGCKMFVGLPPLPGAPVEDVVEGAKFILPE